jgi:uncharacterized protein
VKKVLVDTGPLVALVDTREKLHGRALEELDLLSGPLWCGIPAFTEACFLLDSAYLRRRLSGLIETEVVHFGSPKNADLIVRRSMKWLDRYAEHRPDFADAFLVCWAESDSSAAVWTFDREFSTVWRTLGGKKVPLVFD